MEKRIKTSVIGFPRIGNNRELKFALEKYFNNEITEEELNKAALLLRKKHIRIQKEKGIDFIPSNDFSYYDNVLDTAVLFNIIPKRYTELGLSELDTYFAMARGYQGASGNVKALAMKKWFNTNYHYIVPEIDDDTEIRLSGHKPLDEFKEALNEGVCTGTVITGPFTFLKLVRFMGKKGAFDFSRLLAGEYVKLITKLKAAGAEWIRFDEPFLVTDISVEDLRLFEEIYAVILNNKNGIKVLLQTYFGDVRDTYLTVTGLKFDGIGLDLFEGRKNIELINVYGFPKEKILFAGLVNGKNIWRNDYEKTLNKVEQLLIALNGEKERLVIGTSCSLLHVPYSLENENRLKKEYRDYFAFAVEKLDELKEIALLTEKENNDILIKNKSLFINRPDTTNEEVRKRVESIADEDYERKPIFEEREKIQKERLSLPKFPTTTIGSFPQTADVRKNRNDYRTGKISRNEYIAFNRAKIAECIKLQERIGLDVLVHGEYERNDMVEYFGEHLEGYIFTEKAWVQSYGTRCVKPPVIWGDISRKEPITVEWIKYAAGCTGKKVKGMLTGPVTILNWSFTREDISLKESTLQLALAIRDEVLDLEKNGIEIIQIDEAALREKLPLRQSDRYSEYLDWAIPAFRLVHSGVKPETQIHTHMCYSEFTDMIPAIDAMDADVITFEASRSDLLILDALKENNFKTEAGPGVYDIHSPRVPTVEEIISVLEKMLKKIDAEKLWINPDCGLKTRGEKETEASLINLVKAAKALREKY